MEKGLTTPTDESVNTCADALGFPLPFFYGRDLDLPDANLVSFRSQTAMSAAIRDAALSAGALGFLVSD